jgi:hypothetical protein
MNEFDDKFIASVTDAIVGGINDFEIAALSSLQGLYLQRIHNDRKATDGSSLGQYRSIQYKKKRQAKGRQVGEKDLEFYGDLRRSVKIGKSGNNNVMGFDRDLSRLIAEGQQEQIGKEVHVVSNDELKDMDERYLLEVDFRLNQL